MLVLLLACMVPRPFLFHSAAQQSSSKAQEDKGPTTKGHLFCNESSSFPIVDQPGQYSRRLFVFGLRFDPFRPFLPLLLTLIPVILGSILLRRLDDRPLSPPLLFLFGFLLLADRPIVQTFFAPGVRSQRKRRGVRNHTPR